MPLDSAAFWKGKSACDAAYLGANFMDWELENKILNEVVRPSVQALERFNTAYIGILAVDFILTDRESLFALGFRAFFNDLDIGLFTASVRDDWPKLFDSAIVGSLLDDFSSVAKSNECYIVAKSGNEYVLQEGKTLNQAREKLVEFDGIDEVADWKF
jgi:phosphoribosylamine-glycine ligase